MVAAGRLLLLRLPQLYLKDVAEITDVAPRCLLGRETGTHPPDTTITTPSLHLTILTCTHNPHAYTSLDHHHQIYYTPSHGRREL